MKIKEAAKLFERIGVSGFNSPKKTPSHPTKSHVVVAKEGDKVKTIRFGQQGMTVAHQEKVSRKLTRQEESHLRQDTQATLLKAR